MEEDLITVYLQHACTRCGVLMVSRNRRECKQCKNFQFCDECYETEQKLEHRERHPINQKDKHIVYPSEIKEVPHDTKDDDEILMTPAIRLKKMLDLLVHASSCRVSHCQYPKCRQVKGLLLHGMKCKIRTAGGCDLCKKMRYLLLLHACTCKESECHVPRCRELKETKQMIMRQHAAEVASGSG